MSIKTIECVECGETVPYGRLACPSCGALLAAVAGAPPPAVKITETTAAVPDASAAAAPAIDVPQPVAGPMPAPAAAPEPVAPAAPPAATAAPAKPVAAPRPVATPARSKPKAPQPPAAAEASSNGHEPVAAPVQAKPKAPQPPTPIEAVIPEVAPAAPATTTEAPAQVAYLLEPAADAPPPSTWLTAAAPVVEAEPAEDDSPWPPLLEAESGLVARPYGWSGSPGVAGTAVPPPVPGAYLPPSASGASAMAMTGGPLAGAMAAAPTSDPTAAARLRIADAFVGIDRPRLVEISGWFVLVGSAMAILGFFLPWSIVVIGAGGTGGYLDDWGLASPTHFLVLVGLLAVLGLGVVESPVPPWLRTGVLGLVFGGLLIGLIWPYAIGPLGADIGATVTVLGGVSLLIGGLVATWASRHSEKPPAV